MDLTTEPRLHTETPRLEDTYVEISREELPKLRTSLSDILGKEMKIVVLRGMAEPQILKETILKIIRDEYGNDFYTSATAFFDQLVVPSSEVIAALVRVTNGLRESKYISILFGDLIETGGFPKPIVVDGAILRFYFPEHYQALRARRDLFKATDFISYVPHDEAGLPLCANLPIGPHRDVEVPMASLPINIWFPLQKIPKWRSLLFFPDALRKPLPSFPKGLNEKDPETWGYGRPLQFELNVGDMLLFHCEQFHSTPWCGLDPRLSGEVRIAGACIDDHSSYRRTFASVNTFKSSAGAHHAAEDYVNKLKWVPDGPRLVSPSELTPFGYLASCFDNVEDARRSLCTHESDAIFVRQSCSVEQAKVVYKKISDIEPYSEDRFLSIARLFAAKSELNSATAALGDIISKTASYFWALEAARYALRYKLYDLSVDGFKKSIELAEKSDVRGFRCYSELPTSDVMRQILPTEAIVTASNAIQYIEKLIAPSNTTTLLKKLKNLARKSLVGRYPIPHMDAQLFQPKVRVHLLRKDFHGFNLFACAAFKTFVAIPSEYGTFSPNSAVEGKYSRYVQADSEQELMDAIWLATPEPRSSTSFALLDESARAQIFTHQSKFIVAPTGLINELGDIEELLANGEAVTSSSLANARAEARRLQKTYWPVEGRYLY